MIVLERKIHSSVLTIRLDRPKKRNALNAEMAVALTQALLEAEQDESVRTIVLTGTGKAFSAGADLTALRSLASASRERNTEDSRTLATLFETIYRSDKTVIAQVNGHAIAGGCGLTAVCDFVVAAEHALFGFSEVRIGFVPAIISVYLLERFPEVDIRRAFLRGNLFSARDAEGLGLVSQVVAADDLDETVASLATDLTRETSPEAVAATKALLRARHRSTHQAALEEAVKLNATFREGGDCLAGVAAFLEKLPAPWQEAWDSNT